MANDIQINSTGDLLESGVANLTGESDVVNPNIGNVMSLNERGEIPAVINDNIISSTTCWSSSKTNTKISEVDARLTEVNVELSGDITEVNDTLSYHITNVNTRIDNATASTITVNRHSSAPSDLSLPKVTRSGKVVVVSFGVVLKANTQYYELYSLQPSEDKQRWNVVLVGLTPNLLTITNGVIRFNNPVTLTSNEYLLGELVYTTAD